MLSTRSVALALATLALPVSAQIITSPFPGPVMSNTTPAVIGFVDLSTNGGTQITGIGDDSEHPIVTTVGNGMFPAGSVLIANNGVACAGIAVGEIAYTNLAIPLTFIPNLIPPTPSLPLGIPTNATAVIAAFWDDLVPGTGTSIWWKEDADVLYLMWKNEYHFNGVVGGQTITFEIQVFGNPTFGAPWIQIVYPDTAFGGTMAANDDGASATVGLMKANSSPAIGGNGQWSFNTASVPSGMVLSLKPSTTLTSSSPMGPGSIQMVIRRAPPDGTYFLAVTTFAGAYPNGWLYGLDIPFPELLSELTGGFPFVGPINGLSSFSSGTAVIGPFSGLPSGLTVRAIAFGTILGATGPALVTAPLAYTIP